MDFIACTPARYSAYDTQAVPAISIVLALNFGLLPRQTLSFCPLPLSFVSALCVPASLRKPRPLCFLPFYFFPSPLSHRSAPAAKRRCDYIMQHEVAYAINTNDNMSTEKQPRIFPREAHAENAADPRERDADRYFFQRRPEKLWRKAGGWVRVGGHVGVFTSHWAYRTPWAESLPNRT